MSVARDPERFAAAQYDFLLLWPVGSGGDVAPDSWHTVCEVSRASRARAGADGVSHRQSKCEERGKRGTEPDLSGFDAGKQVKGKKRHVLVDTLGLLLHAIVHPANMQDRDGGIELLTALGARFPLLAKLFADGAYQGPQFREGVAKVRPELTIEIVTRSDQVKGFVVLPKRWIVERTLAWLNRNRRLAKDFENRIRYALAFVRLASIRLMIRKLCNPS
jgi:transposase